MAALLGVGALLLVVGLRHEPWFDEAQGWLIARDDSLWNLLTSRTRHEGTPPLWHLLLVLPARAGLPFRSINVVSGLVTLATVWLLVRRSPFPRWLAAALPFSYFVLYQYGVVARSYCLIAPLLILAAAAFPSRREHPWRWTLPLVALVATSLHGLIIAACWEGVRAVELRREWPLIGGEERRRRLRPALVTAAAIVVGLAEIWPSGDTSGGGSWHLDPAFLRPLLSSSPETVLTVLGIAGIIAGLPWMARRGVLPLFAAPAAGLLALFATRYFSPWHAGIVLELWMACLWIGWERLPRPRQALPLRPPFLRRVLGALPSAERALPWTVVTVLAWQLVWTVHSSAFDIAQPYSGAPALAAYIRDHHLEHRVDAQGKWIIAVLPYFDGVVVADYNGGGPPAYYPWSRGHDPLPSQRTTLRRRMEAIVVAVHSRNESRVMCLPGYRLDAVFPGDIFFGDHHFESEAFAVFRRDSTSAATPSQVCARVPV